MEELYFIVDVEVDGPNIGYNSMLCIGSALLHPKELEVVDTFEINLEPRQEGISDPKTMDWWKQHPVAFAAISKDRVPIKEGMEAFAKWVRSHDGERVFCAQPLSFDYPWIRWYFNLAEIDIPFVWAGLDIATVAAIKLKKNFSRCDKRQFPKELINLESVSHTGASDAVVYAQFLAKLLKM